MENVDGEQGRTFSPSLAENGKESADVRSLERSQGAGDFFFFFQHRYGVQGWEWGLLHLPDSGNHITVGQPDCFFPHEVSQEIALL